ncbi:hypothetical protein FFONT_0126 [Fervidicoccus fontis Kam940]|uniref:Uncharacterized protein n=1 Tax=Fervidicoccus fontis (strain DSM 19380 / JCM 18336 / VKM B-2539 / Kam940) TaxID=1163730 RepID=H9ZZG1_FERFK|nr:hypothetical protein FFONT_0126 [Fervidicoccus fontis Kam940]
MLNLKHVPMQLLEAWGRGAVSPPGRANDGNGIKPSLDA